VSIEGSLLAERYRVIRHLGSGGMASVVLCRDQRLGRHVAVKRLHADSPGEIEQRFTREARLGALLNHPNLVSVYDTTTDDEGVLIVMEYVRGEALSDALRRAPLGFGHVAEIARELGSALDHAHAHGVVHRDVKPSNVLLRDDGVVKLADLGIATAADQTRITRSGTVLGSAAYMAPEQLDGRQPGPAVDVYALSAVLFEALTGQRARTGKTPMELAHAIATEPPPDLRELVPDAPAAAAEVLGRGLSMNPDERPPSAGALASQLAEALESEAPAEDAPTKPLPRAASPSPPPPRASRGLPLALAAALLALAAVATVLVLASGGGGGDASERSQAPQKAEPKQDEPERTTSEAEPQAPAQPAAPAPAEEADPAPAADTGSRTALNDQGFALMGQGRYAEAVPLLRQAVAGWPEESRELEYAYALFNLGKSLNRSGDPQAAIPFLERRLTWPNQRGIVKRELDLARRNAGL